MSSISHRPVRTAQERSWTALFLMKEFWASLAIVAMWSAVAVSAAWAPDFVSTSGGGTTSTIVPSAIAVALFASIGTWGAAKYGFGQAGEGH